MNKDFNKLSGGLYTGPQLTPASFPTPRPVAYNPLVALTAYQALGNYTPPSLSPVSFSSLETHPTSKVEKNTVPKPEKKRAGKKQASSWKFFKKAKTPQAQHLESDAIIAPFAKGMGQAYISPFVKVFLEDILGKSRLSDGDANWWINKALRHIFKDLSDKELHELLDGIAADAMQEALEELYNNIEETYDFKQELAELSLLKAKPQLSKDNQEQIQSLQKQIEDKKAKRDELIVGVLNRNIPYLSAFKSKQEDNNLDELQNSQRKRQKAASYFLEQMHLNDFSGKVGDIKDRVNLKHEELKTSWKNKDNALDPVQVFIRDIKTGNENQAFFEELQKQAEQQKIFNSLADRVIANLAPKLIDRLQEQRQDDPRIAHILELLCSEQMGRLNDENQGLSDWKSTIWQGAKLCFQETKPFTAEVSDERKARQIAAVTALLKIGDDKEKGGLVATLIKSLNKSVADPLTLKNILATALNNTSDSLNLKVAEINKDPINYYYEQLKTPPSPNSPDLAYGKFFTALKKNLNNKTLDDYEKTTKIVDFFMKHIVGNFVKIFNQSPELQKALASSSNMLDEKPMDALLYGISQAAMENQGVSQWFLQILDSTQTAIFTEEGKEIFKPLDMSTDAWKKLSTDEQKFLENQQKELVKDAEVNLVDDNSSLPELELQALTKRKSDAQAVLDAQKARALEQADQDLKAASDRFIKTLIDIGITHSSNPFAASIAKWKIRRDNLKGKAKASKNKVARLFWRSLHFGTRIVTSISEGLYNSLPAKGLRAVANIGRQIINAGVQKLPFKRSLSNNLYKTLSKLSNDPGFESASLSAINLLAGHILPETQPC